MDLERCLDIKTEMDRFLPRIKGFSSRAIHAGQNPNQWSSKSIVPPIHMSVAYELDDMVAPSTNFTYSRTGNPTRNSLEECIANLDDAQFALCFASGLGAMSTIIQMLETGSHILACYDIYGSSYQLFTDTAKRLGIETTFIDFRDTDLIEINVKANTKIIWLESATNPLLRVFDIKSISDIVHAIRQDILVVVDNTFLTSYFLRPLNIGADMTLYSLSKFMNGHSDVIAGALTMNDKDLFNKLKYLQNGAGIIPSPYDCYLVQRSLKTLDIRMMRHFQNGLCVAKFLETHPSVEKVIHPGLITHPDHAVAIQQASGHSGMIAFYIKNANLYISKNILSRLKMIKVAAGLGDIESTITVPSIMSSSPLPAVDRIKLGITDNLFRLSVGLEDPEDLINDLNRALIF